MEMVPLDEFRWHLEVNVTGQLAVTQAFLPLLKRAQGRIVNVGSEGGRITLPFMGAVTASKHALVSVTDALRMELRPWGIQVVLVEPGATKTNAPGKLIDAGRRTIAESFSPVGRADYGDTFGQAIEHIAVGHEKQGSAPDVIARALVRAMTDRKPKTRYPAGGHAKALTRLARILPDRALDTLFMRMLGMPREFGARSAATQGSVAR
jgi:NAD(P)-dependent dehydrogenase (short-subunit alcohol dehydrogenase family)